MRAIRLISLPSIISLCPIAAAGEPFRITDPTHIRADLVVDWAGGAPGVEHNTLVADFGVFPTSESDFRTFGQGSEIRIWNQAGLDLAGVLLTSSGPGPLFLYPPRSTQGFGVTVEHLSPGPATITLSIFRDAGTFLDSKTISIPDGSLPTFIGIIDPDANTGIIGIQSTGGTVALSNPSIQFMSVPETDPAKLPAAATVTEEVDPMDTYFNQGYGNRNADPATETATLSNSNAHELRSWFPDLRPGDVLAFERLGSHLDSDGRSNPLLGVLSATQALSEGIRFRRVPGAIAAGFDFQTQANSSPLGVVTPSNLAEDFLIGASSYVVVPPAARYIFLSRERPGPENTPLSVKVSHIRMQVFEAWIQQRGLAGSLANPYGDADGDGLKLIEEFTFSKDPMRPDAGSRDDFSFSPFADEASGKKGRLIMLFGARRDGAVEMAAQVSADLVNWTTLPENAATPMLGDGESDGRAVFGFADPGSGPRRFGRVRLSYIPPANP